MKRKILLISFLLTSIFGVLFIKFNTSTVKYYLKESLGNEKYLRLSQIKKIVLNKELDIAKYQKFYNGDKYEVLKSINNNLININSSKIDTTINGKKFTINYLPKIFPSVGHGDTNTNYIDFNGEKLYIVFKNGIILKTNIADNSFSKIKLQPNNLNTFIGNSQNDSYFNSFITSKFGIKDVLIIDNQIYASYIEEIKTNGFNTSIIRADINDSLVFEKFFSSEQYIDKNYDEFYPVQSGGRIAKYGKDSILFSIGDYRYRQKAQDSNSINGKILSISKHDKKYRNVSMGHRNVQGLDYLEKSNYIVSTEHGPSGGDEINFNTKVKSLSNYGWPISSYGIHYDLENANNDSHSPDLKRKIKSAPLYKSHRDYGFIEPIKYFKENPGISEVKFIKENENEVEFIVSTLGTILTRPYVKSLLHMRYNVKNNKINLINDYFVGGRVRDLIIKDNRVWYSEESIGGIGSFAIN